MADPGAHPNRKPLLALVLLSPVLAEMLSGSTPPLEWLNPVGVLFLIWLYGAGVLVMRETVVRWKTGWPSILLLGAAYGIIEEGLAVKSFFDPTWMDLGTLGVYGRWLDVNWIWTSGSQSTTRSSASRSRSSSRNRSGPGFAVSRSPPDAAILQLSSFSPR